MSEETNLNNQSTQPKREFTSSRPAFRTPRAAPTSSSRPGGSFNRPGQSGPGQNRPGGFNKRPGGRDFKRQKEDEFSDLESQVISVRRITRVVKGGKRMRFSALVVVGDKAGKVGFGLKKGLDYQDAVNKATKKARESLIKININSEGSVEFISQIKYKACLIFLKPAKTGTGLIAGGFLRPVFELVGLKNVYSKIIKSRNKIAGVQAAFEILNNYKVK